MDETFSALWLLYPRKVARKAAEKAYNKAVKTVPHAAIAASLEIMKRTEWRNREVQYIPHMASWLNSTDPRESFEVQSDVATNGKDALPWRADCIRYGTASWEAEQKRLETLAEPYLKKRQAIVGLPFEKAMGGNNE